LLVAVSSPNASFLLAVPVNDGSISIELLPSAAVPPSRAFPFAASSVGGRSMVPSAPSVGGGGLVGDGSNTSVDSEISAGSGPSGGELIGGCSVLGLSLDSGASFFLRGAS
jgi:hypothetical protein